MIDPNDVKLGRLPTSAEQRAKNFRLVRYLPVELPPQPPLPIDVSEGISNWPMYLNDRLGDCACAAPAHMEEVFSKATGNFRLVSDADVLALYELQGYDPANAATDQGSSMGNVLENWRKGDWKASQIYAFCEVDTSAEDRLQLALWLFRGLYIGIAMPRTVQGQMAPGSTWDVVAAAPEDNGPGTWGGHAVNIIAILANGDRILVSWGTTYRMTKRFWDAYVDECYAVVTHDLMAPDSVLASNGFNTQQLEADMAELGG